MANAAIKTMSKFPDIREDFTQIDDSIEGALKDLTVKLKQVCPADVCTYMLACAAYMPVCNTCTHYVLFLDHTRDEGCLPGQHLHT